MALLDIIPSPGEPAYLEMSRGNSGQVLDVVSGDKNSVEIPAVTGGGGDEIFVLSD